MPFRYHDLDLPGRTYISELCDLHGLYQLSRVESVLYLLLCTSLPGAICIVRLLHSTSSYWQLWDVDDLYDLYGLYDLYDLYRDMLDVRGFAFTTR